jgi:L-threonylcarbamoyladenylate synthase
MKTQYIQIDRENPDPGQIAPAAAIIQQGGLVAFPTETVYGLGANGLDPLAVQRIFAAKGRPADNPLILHIAERDELAALVRESPAWLTPVLDRFWPGPLTVVLPRANCVPDIVTAGLDSVAVRLPSLGAARALIRAAGVPIAAPSANLSGRPSPTTATAVLADMAGRIEMVLDGGPCDVGLESTVLDCTAAIPTILRPGAVTLEMLEQCLGRVQVADAIAVGAASVPRAPGMKYRHYAPAAPLVLFSHDAVQGGQGLLARLHEAQRTGQKVGAIVSVEVAALLPDAVEVVIHGSRENPAEVATALYQSLRWFDTHPVDIIFAEGVPERGIGRALMNRLYKAASSVGEV